MGSKRLKGIPKYKPQARGGLGTTSRKGRNEVHGANVSVPAGKGKREILAPEKLDRQNK